MKISTEALMKLLLLLLATAGITVAGVIPQSACPPACTDIVWDEEHTGFQSRICTMSHPSVVRGGQLRITRRSTQELDDDFAVIFSALMSNTTETGPASCTSSTTTNGAVDEDQSQIHKSNQTSWSNSTSTALERRDTCATRTLPYRTPLIDNLEASSKSWCFRPGPSPNNNDIISLCRNIAQLSLPGSRESPTIPFHDDYVVQRAKGAGTSNTTVENGGSCICVAGRERTAGFKICNCDRCDALVINHGLAGMCKSLQEQCTKKGFSSGYIKSAFGGAMSNSIISLFTYPSAKGGREELVELDPVLAEEGAVVGSCRSGSEGRKGQDYSGPVIDCRTYAVGRFAGGRWCKDMVAGGDRVWVKEKEDPFGKLRGEVKGGFGQFGDV
ncbi:hypothetical protein BKA65DRAFT_547815 [Rhexocercosporidium sp. MPI-PUGE-AT-0058]|nr:hypothetical protein BKA65DRAFT_547815 [Rhexocercosporidium sp. MPI-PUGE-AT-0058]